MMTKKGEISTAHCMSCGKICEICIDTKVCKGGHIYCDKCNQHFAWRPMNPSSSLEDTGE